MCFINKKSEKKTNFLVCEKPSKIPGEVSFLSNFPCASILLSEIKSNMCCPSIFKGASASSRTTHPSLVQGVGRNQVSLGTGEEAPVPSDGRHQSFVERSSADGRSSARRGTKKRTQNNPLGTGEQVFWGIMGLIPSKDSKNLGSFPGCPNFQV